MSPVSCSEITDIQLGRACIFTCSGYLGKQADRAVPDFGGLTYGRSSIVKAIGSDVTIHQFRRTGRNPVFEMGPPAYMCLSSLRLCGAPWANPHSSIRLLRTASSRG